MKLYGGAKKLGRRFLGTKTLGAAIGRLTPIAGWALTIYDVLDISFTNGLPVYIERQAEYEQEYNAPYINLIDNGGLCLAKGTKILMGDGSLKNIEVVQTYDTVKTYNFETKKIESNVVLKVDSPLHNNLIDIVTERGIINSNTTDHPYYVKGKGWCSFSPELSEKHYGIKVKKLSVGDVCYIQLKGKLKKVKIREIYSKQGVERTYNLTQISNSNNYFANGILVNTESKE